MDPIFETSESRKDYMKYSLTDCGPSDDPNCPICTGDWNENNNAAVKTHCGHVFHRDCIVTWLNRGDASPSCPICRALCASSESETNSSESETNSSESGTDSSGLEIIQSGSETSTYWSGAFRTMWFFYYGYEVRLSLRHLNEISLRNNDQVNIRDTSNTGRFVEAYNRVLAQPAVWRATPSLDRINRLSDEERSTVYDCAVRHSILISLWETNKDWQDFSEMCAVMQELNVIGQRYRTVSGVSLPIWHDFWSQLWPEAQARRLTPTGPYWFFDDSFQQGLRYNDSFLQGLRYRVEVRQQDYPNSPVFDTSRCLSCTSRVLSNGTYSGPPLLLSHDEVPVTYYSPWNKTTCRWVCGDIYIRRCVDIPTRLIFDFKFYPYSDPTNLVARLDVSADSVIVELRNGAAIAVDISVFNTPIRN